MKKILFLLFMSVSIVFSAHVDFLKAKDTDVRKYPASSEYIVSYHNILKKVKNSVVNISIQKNIKSDFKQNPFFNDPFFRQFFGNKTPQQVPQERVQRALGSGVIVSSDGYIITNNHVIDQADKITVTIPGDKKEYEAKLIGSDKKSDIAVIKIEKKGLNPVVFYDSDKVKVGDVVFAIGNPFGVGETVTHGIVSALGRNSMGIEEYEDFIQTDAPINPGNSGGALLNSRGELIGINTAIVTRSGSSAGIGFAIPANMVQSIAQQLIEHGEYKRGFLGVTISNITSEMSSFYNGKFGALVSSVGDNTPAQKAGLKRGDLIIAVDGKKVDSASSLKNIIGTYQPGSTVKIDFIRNKQTKTVHVKLTTLDDNSMLSLSSDSSYIYKGIEVVPLTSSLKQQLGISKNITGVYVKDVQRNTQAADAGVLKGDLIIQVDDMMIKNLEQFKKITATKGKKMVWIYRKGSIFAIVL